MTTELTPCPDCGEPSNNGRTCRLCESEDAMHKALTQRPAAQTEREAFEAWATSVGYHTERDMFQRDKYQSTVTWELWRVWQARASLPAPQQATPEHCKGDVTLALAAAQQSFPNPGEPEAGWCLLERKHVEALCRAAQQATPEPLTLGPLAKRNIYDAIRGAYDLGYNDARNARTVPGDSAPGYDGRSVEEDHGGALFNLLSKRLTPATPEPVPAEQAKWCEYVAGMVDCWVSAEWSNYHHMDEDRRVKAIAGIIERRLWALQKQAATPEPVGEPWVVVRETALDVGRGNDVRTGGRPELGYALVSDAATFGSEGEAVAAIESANLPVGWVVLPLSRLLPDLEYTRPAPGVTETDADALLDFMEAHRVSVTPEYEGQWCARQYDDEPQAVAEFEAATPRDAIRALAAAQAKGADK